MFQTANESLSRVRYGIIDGIIGGDLSRWAIYRERVYRSRHVFPFASRTHARMHTRTYVRKYTVQPRSIRFVKRRHSLPFSIPRTDNIVRASRRIPGSAFLAPHDLVSFPLVFHRSVSVYLAERVSSVILSGCITYRAIECPDRDPGTRAPIQSGRSIILSPRNAPPLGNLIGWLKQRA